MTAATAKAFTHLPLFDEPQAWQTAIYRERLLKMMAESAAFRSDFREWLGANWRVWEAFESQANRIWDAGRRRYSARTIGEWLRHETAMRENPNQHGWKLNDHYWPDLARLYVLAHPDRDQFFERRVNPLTLRSA